MESPLYFKILAKCLAMSNYFGCSPFAPVWNGKGTEFRMSVSPHLMKKGKIVYFLLLTHTVYMAGRTVQAYRARDYNQFSFASLFLASGLNAVFTSVIFVAVPHSMAFTFNLENEYFSTYTTTWIPSYNIKTSFLNKVSDFLTVASVSSMIVTHLACTVHHIVFPDVTIYLTSVLNNNFDDLCSSQNGSTDDISSCKSLYFSLRIFGIVFYAHFFGAFYTFITIYILLAKNYIAFVFSIAAKDFKCLVAGKRRSGVYRIDQKLHRPDIFPLAYRCLEVVHRVTIMTYGPIIPPTETLCGYIIILGTFMVTRHSRDLDSTTFFIVAMWAAGMFVLFTLILRFGGMFFLKSKKTIGSWTNFRESGILGWKSPAMLKYIKKFSKSCRPLALEYLGYYRINNFTVLKFWQGVIRGTVRALLALK